MNAYVMTADGIHVVGGAAGLEVLPGEIVLIRGDGAERRPVAAVKLSDRVWVALGERPPARPEASPPAAETPATTVAPGEGGWPPEPPPDVDSEG